MVGGTVDGYLLPEELILDAYRFCEYFQSVDASQGLLPAQSLGLKKLYSVLEEYGDCYAKYDHTNLSELVENDRGWVLLRAHAEAVVELFR